MGQSVHHCAVVSDFVVCSAAHSFARQLKRIAEFLLVVLFVHIGYLGVAIRMDLLQWHSWCY